MNEICKRLTNFLWLVATVSIPLLWGCSCNTTKPTPDPLAGWQIEFGRESHQAIEKDYGDYIQSLPAEEKDFVGAIDFLKDGTGQHAIHLKIGVGGKWWEHVLIYDKNDKRTKVIKYKNGGGYRS